MFARAVVERLDESRVDLPPVPVLWRLKKSMPTRRKWKLCYRQIDGWNEPSVPIRKNNGAVNFILGRKFRIFHTISENIKSTRKYHIFHAFYIGNPTVNIMKILDFRWIWKSYFWDANRNSQPHCFLGWPSLVDSSPLFRCSSTFSFEVWASIFQDLLLTVLYLSENRYCRV